MRLLLACLFGGLLLVGCGGGTISTSGAAGAAGTTGTMGSAGMTGSAGATGSAGSTGAAGTTGAAGVAGADPYAASRQACVAKINMFRATLGLAALARWTAQETCADGQALSDSGTGKAHGAFGKCTEGAQDECPGWKSVDSIQSPSGSCLDQMWAEGPGTDYAAHGHYINMSNPKYTKVACGYTVLATGKVWAVQDLR